MERRNTNKSKSKSQSQIITTKKQKLEREEREQGYLRHPHGEEGDGPVPVMTEDVFGDGRLVDAAVLVETEVSQTGIAHIL